MDGQKWDGSGFILSTKQWKKSDWEPKGQGASRLEPKSEDDSKTVRVLSARPVFADSFSNSLEMVTVESSNWKVGNTKITAYIPVREDRQTKQLHPHSTPSTPTDIYVCTNKILNSGTERVTADDLDWFAGRDPNLGKKSGILICWLTILCQVLGKEQACHLRGFKNTRTLKRSKWRSEEGSSKPKGERSVF